MPTALTPFDPMLVGGNAQELANRFQWAAQPHLKLAVGFALADAAVLYTIPTLPNGIAAVELTSLFWEIGTSFAGGASSAIGVSSSNASYSTKGDLLGGATGDVAAGLLSTGLTYKGGTIGAKYASNGKIMLIAGDTIRFDRITSIFTAGQGYVHINCRYVD
jgi:hypothetical protein